MKDAPRPAPGDQSPGDLSSVLATFDVLCQADTLAELCALHGCVPALVVEWTRRDLADLARLREHNRELLGENARLRRELTEARRRLLARLIRYGCP